jgi:hypothetical protein
MLAVDTAWAILEAEHAHMRRLLDGMDAILDEGHWDSDSRKRRELGELIATLVRFDQASHRPKGVALTDTMRGRSPAADEHLAQLGRERQRDDDLLREASRILSAWDEPDDDPDAGKDRCERLLRALRTGMLQQMRYEETLLRADAVALLSREEWSGVVSRISSSVHRSRTSGA